MSGTRIPADLTRTVRRRARDCCEYCHLEQRWQEAEFHIDHVRPRCLGGPSTTANLALACVSCSLRKASRTQARDPVSDRMVRLFNPRQDAWVKHFKWSREWKLKGLTPIGRATVAALKMNGSRVVRMRKLLAGTNLFPATDD